MHADNSMTAFDFFALNWIFRGSPIVDSGMRSRSIHFPIEVCIWCIFSNRVAMHIRFGFPFSTGATLAATQSTILRRQGKIG